jgi:hypothetical protein
MEEAQPAILDHLGITAIERSELPFGFKPLTIPMSLYERAVIESLWQTLRGVALVTREKGNTIQFWREPPPKPRPKEAKHRANPNERWRSRNGL